MHAVVGPEQCAQPQSDQPVHLHRLGGKRRHPWTYPCNSPRRCSGLLDCIGLLPPEITLQANYPGADAQTLEQAVATPIEQQVSGVDNMTYM